MPVGVRRTIIYVDHAVALLVFETSGIQSVRFKCAVEATLLSAMNILFMKSFLSLHIHLDHSKHYITWILCVIDRYCWLSFSQCFPHATFLTTSFPQNGRRSDAVDVT